MAYAAYKSLKPTRTPWRKQGFRSNYSSYSVYSGYAPMALAAVAAGFALYADLTGASIVRIRLLEILTGGLVLVALPAALRQAYRSAKRQWLLARQRGLADLQRLSWRDFELLVGQAYRNMGYQVTEVGQGGADGGVDLVLRRQGITVLVQCKRWRATNVGAPIVREMLGLLVHHKADRAVIVTVGHFTKDALAFAVGNPVELVSGDKLVELVKSAQGGKQ